MLDGVMKECDWLDDDDTLNFLHKTVSVNQHRVKPSYGKARIDYDVADCRVVGGAEPVLGNCRLRVISLKNAPDTIPAALAALDTLPFEHRYTLRWMGLEHGEGLRHIERQLRDWKMLGIAMIPMLISYMLRSDKQKENQAANAMAEDAVEALYAARRDELTIGHANINVVVWDRDRHHAAAWPDRDQLRCGARGYMAGDASRSCVRRPAPADPHLGQPVPLRALQ
jgi:hypothetical protein